MLRRITLGTVVVMATVLVVTVVLQREAPAPARALPGPTGEKAPAGLERFYGQEPAWRPCGRYRCTTVRVPLDYAKPKGATISLAVRMLPARDGRTDRLLFVNPGGPGGSGVEYVPIFADEASAAMRQKLSIVGVDPRGVNESSPIECVDRKTLDAYLEHDSTPDTPKERETLVRAAKKLGAACRERSGDLVDHVSTQESARDLDVVRAVLGQRTLTYFGASYGTQLGATYADLFPRRTGRMVLDGGVDVDLRRRDLLTEQVGALQKTFERFLRWCGKRDDCPLDDDPKVAELQVVRLVVEAEDTKLKSDGDVRDANQTAVLRGFVFGLTSKESWPALSYAVSRAEFGDGTAFRQLSDASVQRGEDDYDNNSLVAGIAVRCLDDPQETSIEQVRPGLLQRMGRESALFGPSTAWSATLCDGWGAKGLRQPSVRAEGAGPIVVIGTTHDPVTPVRLVAASHEGPAERRARDPGRRRPHGLRPRPLHRPRGVGLPAGRTPAGEGPALRGRLVRRPQVPRWGRRAVVATVVLGLVCVAVALTRPSPAQRDQVAAADRVASRYERALDEAVPRFAEKVRQGVLDNTDDFAEAHDVLRAAVKRVPRIPTAGTTAYGRSHSERYREARTRRDVELEPYVTLAATLEVAERAQAFIEAGTKVIRVNPAKLLEDQAVTTGRPLRDEVVPAFRKARSDLAKHPPPKGSEVLARDLRTYLKDAISTTEDGADALDAGRPFFFDFGKRPQDLQRRLQTLQRTLVAQVVQVLDEVVAPQ
ncbi:MAG: alpha/beta fold hydrolase [Aeromicrobium erythreum]